MRVILLQDVTGIGQAGAVTNVADGYANNFLIPRKLAMRATEGELKSLEQHRQLIKRRQAAGKTGAAALGERLAGITLRLKAKAGEAGRLYGSITNAMIAEALASDHHVEVDRRDISIPYPIRMLGEHQVTVRLHKEVEAALKVEVEAEAESGS